MSKKNYIFKNIPNKKKVNNGISLGCLIMVKNEEKRICITLKSVKDFVDYIIIYDTGSEDDTVDVIKNYCVKNEICLYIIVGKFVNFSKSRNVLIEYAETLPIDYFLLLDCNDELKGGEEMINILKKTNKDGYYITQEWVINNRCNKYYNIRLIKSGKRWRYKGVVHEWLESDQDNIELVKISNDKILIYQDRNKDNEKSKKRFKRDYELLLEEHKKDPKNSRTLFYLAQTCQCIGLNQEALDFYKLRTKLLGFEEEVFQSYLRIGKLSELLNKEWKDSMYYYIKAFEISNRVEPLIKISNYYKNNKQYILSYTFINVACSLPYPKNSFLFVDKEEYDYVRWHIMGVVAYYCGKYQDGYNACLMAIKNGSNIELDSKNLKFYKDKLNFSNSDLVLYH